MGAGSVNAAVVVAAAEWFVGVDGVIDETEKEFLTTVGELLGQ